MDVRKAALKSLIKILEKHCQADDIVNHYSKDVLFPSELNMLVSGVIKHKLTLDFYIQAIASRKIKDLSYQVINTLRLGIFELEFLENPDYAVINSYVEIIKEYDKKLGGFINAILRNFLRKKQDLTFPDIEKFPVEHISVKYSHPEWMVKNWIKHYGIDETINICKYNNQAPKLILRVNTLKSSKENLLNLIKDNNTIGFEDVIVDDCIVVQNQGNIKKIPGFDEGYWVVQGESSALVSIVLDPQPNERILDLCAAPGGKTTHIAALMQDKGEIIAVDINPKRSEKINNNCMRLGIHSVKTQVSDAGSYSTEEKFDRILVDAPCSNTGVLTKRTDARWNKSPEDITNLAKLQLEILNNAAKSLKLNGIMVYSTCSIEPEENKQVVEKFLEANKDFCLDDLSQFLPFNLYKNTGYYQILQSRNHIDGFFIARLKKSDIHHLTNLE